MLVVAQKSSISRKTLVSWWNFQKKITDSSSQLKYLSNESKIIQIGRVLCRRILKCALVDTSFHASRPSVHM